DGQLQSALGRLQISDTLKRFAVKVTTASVKERREILSELGKCISGKDLPEGAVKGLCKLFCLTLHRYRDAASRRALQLALQQLAESQPDATAKNLLQSLQSSGIGGKAGVPSKSSGSAALLALSWTCLLVRTVFPTPDKRQGETWKKLVEVQCLLFLEVLGGSHKQAVDGAVKKLNRLWKENQDLVDQYLSVILSLEPNQSYAAMLGLVVQFCTAQKEVDIVKRYKSALLDFYLKTILMSKTKPQKHVLDSCSPLLRYMSHAEFKDLVLPTLQKSLLRSPENVIESESVISLHCSGEEREQLFLRGLELLEERVSLSYASGPVSAGSRMAWCLKGWMWRSNICGVIPSVWVCDSQCLH
ncbi:PREDICTED: translational activator GCN1-like, partial [Chlamydotis macqueenii]|uniref:translational activator GCN1-like n=1 Tax=Chlamydotis macqueenii TaxID=187382 RepID=UPI000529B169